MRRRIITHRDRPALIQQREDENLPPLAYRKLRVESVFVDTKMVNGDSSTTESLCGSLGLDIDKYVVHRYVTDPHSLMIMAHYIKGGRELLIGCRFLTKSAQWRNLPLLFFPHSKIKHRRSDYG